MIRPGNYVKYNPTKGTAFTVHKVLSLHPAGNETNRYPMLKVSGINALVLTSKCEKVGLDEFSVKDGFIFDCGCECVCHSGNAPCSHCTDHCVGEVV